MKDLYQKPAIRFAESPLESAMGSTVCRVYVGVACVGRVEIQPPNDEDPAEDRCWFVTAVYGSSMGQDCEQWKCNDFDEAWSVAERWLGERWDKTWRMLCGKAIEIIHPTPRLTEAWDGYALAMVGSVEIGEAWVAEDKPGEWVAEATCSLDGEEYYDDDIATEQEAWGAVLQFFSEQWRAKWGRYCEEGQP